ncbi:MAG: glycosyltransferase [Paludibacter sp.]|nr:glycosyltransferase [Paludibacter sp.]
MKFSIVIPVYNVEKYLEQCLQSLQNQTFTDFEVICVNDGSTDNSLEIINNFKISKQWDFKIINQKNGGLSDARNAGIRVAKGNYILFLDSDDWIAENALEILNNNIDNQDFIAFNGERFFEDGKIETPDNGILEEKLTGWEYYNKYALVTRKFHFVCVVLRLYRREFLIENNLFFKKGIFHEDNLFTPICCYYAENVKVIPDILYFYRIREGSITQNVNPKRVFDMVNIANLHAEFFIPQKVDKSVVYREIAGEYFKGFMPDEIKKYGNNDQQLRQLINWEYFKTTAKYPRHKRIYQLLKIGTAPFHLFLKVEKGLKKFI